MTKKGFTLIELLTVVLIVAILMGVGLPQYRKAVDKARVTEAEAMLRTLYDSSERLAGEFGYRSYKELVDNKADTISLERFDMVDPSRLPTKCKLDASASMSQLSCSRFKYRALVKGNNDRYYVAAKLLKGTNSGTYILFDRETRELYCQPKQANSTDFCDVLGLDSLNTGLNF